jgi:hypothetical protein
MLAPRKKLWTTPIEVVDAAIELLKPNIEDIVYDIGAGEGNFIVRCCETTGATCVGIEIEADRAAVVQVAILEKGLSSEKCKMVVGNALDQDYSTASCIFLYLVPRGLRLIYPLLKNIGHKVRIVTYMSPLPGEEAVTTVKIATRSHPEALWPLYYYELN